ncbi:unnamed protein product [Closterium sp. NIES-64]|nr:unnamed protein product [Closterium sp. NIES-64]
MGVDAQDRGGDVEVDVTNVAEQGAGRDPMSTGGRGTNAASIGDKSRRKAPAHGQPALTTSFKSALAAALPNVKRLEEENRRLRGENTGLRSALDAEKGRTKGLLATAAGCLEGVKSLTERVVAAEQTAGTHVSNATAAMSTVFAKVLDDWVALVKMCGSMAVPLVGEITKELAKLGAERSEANQRLANHVSAVAENVKSKGGAGGSAEGRTGAEEGVQTGMSFTHADERKGQRGAPNAVLLPTGGVSGPPVGVQAPTITLQIDQVPAQMVGVEEEDPMARALMEELLVLQAPSHQPPVASANAAVPTPHVGLQPVAGVSTSAPCTDHTVAAPRPPNPVAAESFARQAAAPSAHPPSGPNVPPTACQHVAGPTPPTESVSTMLLAEINARQVAAPFAPPPTTGSAAPTTQHTVAETTGTSSAPTTVNLGEPVLQAAARETTVPPADPTPFHVGAVSEKSGCGTEAIDGGGGEMPLDPIFNNLIIGDEDVELLQAVMDEDEHAVQQAGAATSANVVVVERSASVPASN